MCYTTLQDWVNKSLTCALWKHRVFFFYLVETFNVAATLQVGQPKEEPKLPVSLWGFTENAEVWNSRAAMIGIFGIVIVEAVSTCTNLQIILL